MRCRIWMFRCQAEVGQKSVSIDGDGDQRSRQYEDCVPVVHREDRDASQGRPLLQVGQMALGRLGDEATTVNVEYETRPIRFARLLYWNGSAFSFGLLTFPVLYRNRPFIVGSLIAIYELVPLLGVIQLLYMGAARCRGSFVMLFPELSAIIWREHGRMGWLLIFFILLPKRWKE